jgi:hypothetical protein
MIIYKLDCYTPNGFKFIFNDGRYTIIDLVNEYNNYIEPSGNLSDKNWHYTVKEIDNNLYNIGDVLYLERTNGYNSFYKNGIYFKKSKQCELDYYQYISGKNTDNAKVYNAIKKLLNPNIRETTL